MILDQHEHTGNDVFDQVLGTNPDSQPQDPRTGEQGCDVHSESRPQDRQQGNEPHDHADGALRYFAKRIDTLLLSHGRRHFVPEADTTLSYL